MSTFMPGYSLSFLTVPLVLLVTLVACTTDQTNAVPAPRSTAEKQQHIAQIFQEKNTLVAENITAQIATRMPRSTRIITTAFVDLENFEQSTPLGRLVSSQIADHLTQAGYTVEEYRLRKVIGIRRQNGEFILTRDTAQMLADTFQAEAVLLGNYLVDTNTLFLSVRVVRLDTRAVVAAYNYTLPNKALMHRLLAMEEEEKIQPEQTFSHYLRPRGGNTMSSGSEASVRGTPAASESTRKSTPQEIFRLFPTETQ